MIAASTSCDFAFLRNQPHLDDSNPSQHLRALDYAGYVNIRKSGAGRGSTITHCIAPTGRSAHGRRRAAGAPFLRSTP